MDAIVVQPQGPDARLAEPSLADLLVALEQAVVVSPAHRTHWSTSIRQMASYLDRPPRSIPARINAISTAVKGLHPERLGVNAKTFANHRGNFLAAIRWFTGQAAVRRGTTPLGPQYAQLLAALRNRHDRDVLSPFLRFLAQSGIPVAGVRDKHLPAFADHRTATSFVTIRGAMIRRLVRLWNAAVAVVPGCGAARLAEPAYAPRSSGPAWSSFPQGLRDGIDGYCRRIGTRHRGADGRVVKACSSSTVEMRRRELVAAVRTAVAAGIALDDLQSLPALLEPERVEVIINAYWERNGEVPTLYTIDLAWRFLSLARTETGFGPTKLERLDEIYQALAEYRSGGLTEKNRAVVRQVINTDVWRRVLQLPDRMMASARATHGTKPIRAGVTAALAVAIRILTVAPIRMQNLAGIQLGQNLVRPGGPGAPYLLVFPDYDVKNRVALEFPLDADTTAIISEYVRVFRPNLMRGRQHEFLFPGAAHDGKVARNLSSQIAKRISKELGLAITPHQFRHAAAALMLMHEPGNFELVRRVLGHRNIQTTINFYIGLEAIAATRKFGEMVTALVPEQKQQPIRVRRRA